MSPFGPSKYFTYRKKMVYEVTLAWLACFILNLSQRSYVDRSLQVSVKLNLVCFLRYDLKAWWYSTLLKVTDGILIGKVLTGTKCSWNTGEGWSRRDCFRCLAIRTKWDYSRTLSLVAYVKPPLWSLLHLVEHRGVLKLLTNKSQAGISGVENSTIDRWDSCNLGTVHNISRLSPYQWKKVQVSQYSSPKLTWRRSIHWGHLAVSDSSTCRKHPESTIISLGGAYQEQFNTSQVY